jgi:hypothetical protein
MNEWSLLEIASAVVFGGWFIVSIIGQVTPRESALRASRFRTFIPDWRFFAPEPALEDRIVWFRRRSATGALGDMEAIEFPHVGAFRWLWNPLIRQYKAVFDLAEGLRPRFDKDQKGDHTTELPDSVVLSEPYLALLNLVTARAGASGPGLVQFGIVLRKWPKRDELVFLSRWHTIDS